MTAILFDLYGTLLELRDSQPFFQVARHKTDVRSALETALTTNNSSLNDFATRIGVSAHLDLPALNAALAADLDSVQPYPDVKPTLSELKRRGIRMALISNVATPYKQPFFAFQLDAFFDVMIFSCDFGFLKPDPTIYRHALKQLGASSDETLMVGDSVKSDVVGPSKIGIMGIHLVRSSESSKADHVICSLDGLLEKIP